MSYLAPPTFRVKLTATIPSVGLGLIMDNALGAPPNTGNTSLSPGPNPEMLNTMMAPSTAAKVKVASAPTADVVSVPDEETATLTAGVARVIVTVAGVPKTAETLPAASLAQGKKVWLPAAAAVTVAGAVAVHPASVAAGGVVDWVTMYPVTATLSVAVNALMLTDRLVATAGMVNAVTAGAVVSGTSAAASMFTVAGCRGAETLPAPSLAQQ